MKDRPKENPIKIKNVICLCGCVDMEIMRLKLEPMWYMSPNNNFQCLNTKNCESIKKFMCGKSV